jgi:transcriptional regulator with XRE-family HTH domain
MPSTPPQRLKTSLRKLRVILGDYGAPMSQEKFASETGLSVNTLRAIENERLPLSENVLKPIAARWLAMWNPRDEEWHFLETKKLYDKELAKKVLPTRPPADDGLMIEKLIDRLRSILAAIGSEVLPGQIMLLNRLLRKFVEENSLNVDLNPTEPQWLLRRHPTEPRMWLVAEYPARARKNSLPKPYPNGKKFRKSRKNAHR